MGDLLEKDKIDKKDCGNKHFFVSRALRKGLSRCVFCSTTIDKRPIIII